MAKEKHQRWTGLDTLIKMIQIMTSGVAAEQMENLEEITKKSAIYLLILSSNFKWSVYLIGINKSYYLSDI